MDGPVELLRSAEYIQIVQQHLYNTTAVVLASEFRSAFIYMALSVGVGAMEQYSASKNFFWDFDTPYFY